MLEIDFESKKKALKRGKESVEKIVYQLANIAYCFTSVGGEINRRQKRYKNRCDGSIKRPKRNDSCTYILRFVGFQVVRVKYRPLVEFININPFMEIRFVFEFSKCRVRSRQKRRKIGK